jgi:hypothetical protein
MLSLPAARVSAAFPSRCTYQGAIDEYNELFRLFLPLQLDLRTNFEWRADAPCALVGSADVAKARRQPDGSAKVRAALAAQSVEVMVFE